MMFNKGQRVEVDGRKATVISHSAKEPHLVVILYDRGTFFKVGMHRVRAI